MAFDANSYKRFLRDKLINELTNDGHRAIQVAYQNRDFRNQLWNLYDSYGSAVYEKGRLIKHTVRYLGNQEQSRSGRSMGWTWKGGRTMPTRTGQRYHTGDEIQMNGRDEVIDFFQQYRPQHKTGIQLVIVAAMFYANILESGVGKIKRKIKVISGARDAMEDIAKKYGGTFFDIETGRVLSIMPTPKDKTWAR